MVRVVRSGVSKNSKSKRTTGHMVFCKIYFIIRLVQFLKYFEWGCVLFSSGI